MTRRTFGRRWLLLLLAAALVAGSACGRTAPPSEAAGGGSASEGSEAAKPVQIQLSYQAAPTDNPWHNMANRFKDAVEKSSAGRITVQLFPGGQLSGGNQQKELELLQNGTIQASIMPSSTLSSIDARFGVVSLPWILPDFDAVRAVIDGDLGAEMMGWLDAQGLHAVAIGSNGFRQLTNSKHPVTTPDDVKGLKIRVPGNAVLLATWKTLGADPVAIDYAELYTALQQGTVDGQDLPFEYVLSDKIYEVNRYATELNYSFDMIFLTFNKSFWDGLSHEDQTIITQAAREAMAWEVDAEAQGQQAVEDQLQAAGMQVDRLTADQVAAFRQKVSGVYDSFAPKVGADVLKRFEELSSSR